MLTHIDAYTPEGDGSSDSEEDEVGASATAEQQQAGGEEFDREAELPGIISLW